MLHASPLKTVDFRHRASSYHEAEELVDGDDDYNRDGNRQEETNFNDSPDLSEEDDDDDDDPLNDYTDQTFDQTFDQTVETLTEQGQDQDQYQYQYQYQEQDQEPRHLPEMQTQTEYHQVNTIPEEQSELVDTTTDLLPPKLTTEENSRPDSPARNLEQTINEEILLEVLTEVNWGVNDDSSSLLEKLHSRLADVDYQFNKSLLLLPQGLKELVPFKDRVFKECDKLDPTLSLFTMELSSVSNDIDFVESQRNGLQVRVANRKLLWNELNEILDSVSINEQALRELLTLPVSKTSIERIETLLSKLYAALKAIDGSKDQFLVQRAEYDLSDMRALSERRHAYERVKELFIERIQEQMAQKYKEIERATDNTKDALANTLVFSSLILFCKDVSANSYEKLIDMWNDSVYKLYERKTNILLSKMRPVAVNQNSQQSHLSINQSEQDALFDWWYTLRVRKAPYMENTDLNPQLVSAIKATKEMESICIVYQNFASAFFHLSSRHSFNDFVDSVSPNERGFTDLQKIWPMESVRKNASNINNLVSKIMQNQLVKFFKAVYTVAANNRLDNPALLLYLEERIKDLESSNQEVLRNYLIKAYQRIQHDFSSYIDEHCVYIERAVINFKSRSLSPSIVSLPVLTRTVENSLKATVDWLHLDPNFMYDSHKFAEQAYMRIADSTLKLLTTSTTQDVSSEIVVDNINSNSTEKLDETVSILLNANLILETLPLFDMDVFSDVLQEAKRLFDAEKETYSEMLLTSSMRDLTAFVQGAQSLIKSGANGAPTANSHTDPKQWAAYSEQNLNKILSSYTSREIADMIDQLYANMESHFHTADPTANNATKILCQKLWSNIQGRTVSFYLSLYSLIERHYKNTSIQFNKNDIIAAFEHHK